MKKAIVATYSSFGVEFFLNIEKKVLCGITGHFF
jgi:hypothetical protein